MERETDGAARVALCSTHIELARTCARSNRDETTLEREEEENASKHVAVNTAATWLR